MLFKYSKVFFLIPIFIFFFSSKSFAVEIMPIKDIKPGMIGVTQTVFYGEKKESFKVKILSIVNNLEPQTSVILAKFIGKNVQESGIAEGMSGSPVYINGKLIGAIAFTWGFLREPIGGIQPIGQMLSALEEPEKKQTLSAHKPLIIKKPMIDLNHANSQMNYIDTPLVISGFSDAGYNFFEKSMKERGINIAQNAGGGSVSPIKGEPSTLKPGDAVGILLMTGDASASAIGTVTYVDPKDPRKVLIFGHPFQGTGYVEYPMTRAMVHYTMPSLNISWKFATTTKIVGTIYNDRKTGVAGKIGPIPKMVPVSIHVFDENKNKDSQFHYQIVKDPNFFPNLLAGALVSSFARYNGSTMQTVHVDLNIEVQNTKTGKIDALTVSDYLVGASDDTTQSIAGYIVSSLKTLFYNNYNAIEIKSAEATLKYVNNIGVATISQVISQKNAVSPGENAEIKVILNTFQNKKEVVDIDVPVPSNYDQPFLQVTLMGQQMEESNFDSLYQGARTPYDYTQLLKMLSIKDRAKNLIAYYDIKGVTANVNGYKLTDLPLSKAIDYGIKMQGNKFFGAIRQTYNFNTNYIITGQAQVLIPIKSEE